MAYDLYAETTARIIARMEQGAAPWVKAWSGGSAIPQNAISNRPYSGINILLFWLSQDQGYKSARYLTFKQAKESGGTVRAGEHGTRVVYFKQLTIKDKESDEDKTIPMLKHYTVFNVAQCDNLPANIVDGPNAGVINPDNRESLADDFIKASGADFREGTGAPYYVPSKDFISIPAFADFRAMPDFYRTAFHELSHWTGHKSRLDRDLSTRFGTNAYAAEELIAELSSAFLCAEFGFDNLEQNAAYLTSWIDLLKNDKRAIFTAASKASAAANYLRELALRDQSTHAIAA